MALHNMGFNGYHVLPYVKSESGLIAHVLKMSPRWMLVVNNPNLARKIKNASPNTQVVMRHHLGKDDYWLNRSPQDFITYVRSIADNRTYWHMGVNECWNFEYELEVMKLVVKQPDDFNYFAFNFSVGTPEDESVWQTKPAIDCLKLASENPTRIVLSFHQYGMGSPVAGWQDEIYDVRKPETWPLKGDFNRKNWLLGRHNFAIKAFLEHYPNARRPRVVIGEAGVDYINDPNIVARIGQQLHGGIGNQAQWMRDNWGLSPDHALHLWAFYEAMGIYRDCPEVEGRLHFCWGENGDEKWKPHNVENMTGYLQMQERWEVPERLPQFVGWPKWWQGYPLLPPVAAPTPLPEPVPVPVPPPDPLPPPPQEHYYTADKVAQIRKALVDAIDLLDHLK